MPLNHVAHKYFLKSKKSFRRLFYCLIAFILSTQINRIVPVHAIISSLLVMGLMFAIVTFNISGLVYGIKSYLLKEPFYKYRMFYMLAHVVIFILLVILFMGVANDIKKIK